MSNGEQPERRNKAARWISERTAAVAGAAWTWRRPRRARVFVVSATRSVALIERRKGGLRYWAVPGGGIETGESPEQAAVREAREELGIDVVLHRRVGQYGRQVYFVAHLQDEVILRLGGLESERNTATNSYTPRWVSLEEAKTLWLRPPEAAKAALARLLDRPDAQPST